MADTIQLDKLKARFIREDLILLTTLLRQYRANTLAYAAEDRAYHLTELLQEG